MQESCSKRAKYERERGPRWAPFLCLSQHHPQNEYFSDTRAADGGPTRIRTEDGISPADYESAACNHTASGPLKQPLMVSPRVDQLCTKKVHLYITESSRKVEAKIFYIGRHFLLLLKELAIVHRTQDHQLMSPLL